jgi:ParB/RepB/Spo0J family partition protein
MSFFLFFIRDALSISIAAAKASSSTHDRIIFEMTSVALNGRLTHAFQNILPPPSLVPPLSPGNNMMKSADELSPWFPSHMFLLSKIETAINIYLVKPDLIRLNFHNPFLCVRREAFFFGYAVFFLAILAGKLQFYQAIFRRVQMSKKPNKTKPAYKQILIDVDKIKPSPYQVRKFFDEGKKKELAGSIQRDGLIQPIVVRRKNGGPELIAGERRVQAIRDYTGIKSVPARVVEVSDIQARRIAAAENFQREDLTTIETVEAIVELMEAELIEDKQYASMGKNPADRVKTLLVKLDTIRRSKKRGSTFTNQTIRLSNK